MRSEERSARPSRVRGGRALAATAAALAVVSSASSVGASCPPGEALSVYENARHAFDEKRFEEAIPLLRRAYACEANPVYLGNIARAFEEATRPEEALAAWLAYLSVTTNPEERQRTEGRISALRKVVADRERLERDRREAEAARRRAEAQVRAQAAAPSASPVAPRVATAAWVTGAAGGVALLGGGVLGLLANAKHAAAVADRSVTGAEDLQSTARTFASAANVTLAVGGILAAVGVVWTGIDLALPTRGEHVRAALVLSPWGIALAGAM